tara:strand:+ start:2947 stop:3735 length:789 start_codon:yes stop_codon:yes gene_type:complete
MDREGDNRKIRPNAFVKEIQKHPLFKKGDQTDVNELWLNICDRIHEDVGIEVPEPEIENNKHIWKQISKKTSQWSKQFMGVVINMTVCNNPSCKTKNKNIEVFYSIPIQPNKNITSGLIEFFKVEHIQDDGWKCDKCGCGTYMRYTKPLILPKILAISVNRFNNNMTKNHKDVNINKKIRFNKGSIIGDPTKQYDYKMVSFINHYGVLHGGHYNCYRYDQTSPENTLTLYDDDLKEIINKKENVDNILNSREVYLIFYSLIE